MYLVRHWIQLTALIWFHSCLVSSLLSFQHRWLSWPSPCSPSLTLTLRADHRAPLAKCIPCQPQFTLYTIVVVKKTFPTSLAFCACFFPPHSLIILSKLLILLTLACSLVPNHCHHSPPCFHSLLLLLLHHPQWPTHLPDRLWHLPPQPPHGQTHTHLHCLILKKVMK